MKKPEEVLGGKKSSKHKDKKKKRHVKTSIEHHDDGSHTMRHTDEEGKETSYAVPDMAGVHAGLDNNVGAPPSAEEAAEGEAPPVGGPPAGAPPGGAPPAA